MDIGGGGFSFGGQDTDGTQTGLTASNESGSSELPESSGNPSDGIDASQPQGDLPENFDASQFGDFDPSQFGGRTPESSESPAGDAVQSPNGTLDSGTKGTSFSSAETLIQYGLGLAVIAIAFVFAVFYRRKPRRR